MRLNDLTLGLVVLLGAFAIFLSSLQFSPIPGQAYGAETMPSVIALLAAGTGFFMIGKALAAGERVPRIVAAPWTRSRRSIFGFFLTIALVITYILFSRALGFLPIAFVVTAALMLALGVHPVKALLVSVIAVVVIQFAFGRLLLVPLPRSSLFPFLG